MTQRPSTIRGDEPFWAKGCVDERRFVGSETVVAFLRKALADLRA
jgi:hypothetical protein